MRSVAICILTICMLGACAGVPRSVDDADSACAKNEASYDCQVERYRNVKD